MVNEICREFHFQGTVDRIGEGLAYLTVTRDGGEPQLVNLEACIMQDARIGEGDDFEFYLAPDTWPNVLLGLKKLEPQLLSEEKWQEIEEKASALEDDERSRENE